VTRLNIVVEGQTEEAFVRDLLAPHLMGFGIATAVRCVQTGRKRGTIFRGGVLSYTKLRRDLALWMKEDQARDAFYSTLVDLYHLPEDFPGHEAASKASDPLHRVAALERSFCEDIAHHLGQFIPYIQAYEFEALLFSRPEAFAARFPGRADAAVVLRSVRAGFPSPEHIDDDNPPSKRIRSVLPDYDKVADGTILARSIGLATIRLACSHFDEWLRRLESILQPG
jgi:hypothetical protein